MTVPTRVRSRNAVSTHFAADEVDEVEVYGDVAFHGCQRTLCGLAAGAPYLETTTAISCTACIRCYVRQGDPQ